MGPRKKGRQGKSLPGEGEIVVEEIVEKVEYKFSKLALTGPESSQAASHPVSQLAGLLSPEHLAKAGRIPTPEPELPSPLAAKRAKASDNAFFLGVEAKYRKSRRRFSASKADLGSQSDSEGSADQAPYSRPSSRSGPGFAEQAKENPIGSARSKSKSKSKPKPKPCKSPKDISKTREDDAERIRRNQENAEREQMLPLLEEDLRVILRATALEDLEQSPKRCTSNTSEGQRCKHPRRYPEDGALNVVDSLEGLDLREDWDEIYAALASLVDTWLCGGHRRMAMVKLMALDGRMVKWASEENKGAADGIWKESRLRFVEPWLDQVFKGSKGEIQKLRKIFDENANVHGEDITESSNLTSTHSPCLRVFVPRYRQDLSHITVQQAIRKALEKDLKPRELTSGHVYIYESLSAPGYVKIGVAIDFSARKKTWEKQCGHDVQEHSQNPFGRQAKIENAYRVELLVQRELRDFRVRELECCGCGREHTEWFKVDPVHAAKVVKKYATWTEQKPYQLHKRSRQWLLDLKRIQNDEIEKLCIPIEI